MFNRFPFINFFIKSPANTFGSSLLPFSKLSHTVVSHTNLHPNIDLSDLNPNGFLLSDDEKEKILFYMAVHHDENEVISGSSPLNQGHFGAVIINREKGTIYKIYDPETKEEKKSRKALQSFKIKKSKKGIIGKGSFGEIYICQDLITGKWYAAKKIKKSILERVCYLYGLNNFNQPNEIEFLKQENLFVDHIETADKYYIIEKLIFGCNLDDYIYQTLQFHPLCKETIEQIFNILNMMVESVANFHRHNSIHCDISLDNFLYDKNDNKIYLIDFGLSMNLSGKFKGIYCLDVFGKNYYIAPEIDKNFLSYYSYSSDVYALGKCFKRILSAFDLELSSFYTCYYKLHDLASEMTNKNINYRTSDLSYISKKLNVIKQQCFNHLNDSDIIKDENTNPKPLAPVLNLYPNYRDLLFFRNTIKNTNTLNKCDNKENNMNCNQESPVNLKI